MFVRTLNYFVNISNPLLGVGSKRTSRITNSGPFSLDLTLT